MALGGSTNTVLHLMAIAMEAEIPLSLDDFSSLAEEIPHICYMQPSGPHSMQTLHRAGGIPAVLKRLEKYLDDSPTVSGKKILQIAKAAQIRNEEVIRSLKNPINQARRTEDPVRDACTGWCCREECSCTKGDVETQRAGTGFRW